MLYKKSLFLWGMVLWLLLTTGLSTTYAQETQTNMEKVTMRFCNTEWELKHDDQILVEPGKESKLRLCANNAGDTPIKFMYAFTEGQYTEWWIRVCDWNFDTGNKFALIIPWTKERTIAMEPKSSAVVEENIVIPPGMSGLQLWCLIYKLEKPDPNQWGMFIVEVGKYGWIDVMVGGEATVKNKINIIKATWWVFSTNKNIKVTVDKENNLIMSVSLSNQGNIAQNVSITGKVYNVLGYQQTFSIDTKKVTPGVTGDFSVNVGMLPIYKWLYSVKLNIQTTPEFLFPVSDEKLKQPQYIVETWSVFVFSRILVGAAIIILLIVYKLLIPKRAKKTQPITV